MPSSSGKPITSERISEQLKKTGDTPIILTL